MERDIIPSAESLPREVIELMRLVFKADFRERSIALELLGHPLIENGTSNARSLLGADFGVMIYIKCRGDQFNITCIYVHIRTYTHMQHTCIHSGTSD